MVPKPGTSFLIVSTWSTSGVRLYIASFEGKIENGDNLQMVAKGLEAFCEIKVELQFYLSERWHALPIL